MNVDIVSKSFSKIAAYAFLAVTIAACGCGKLQLAGDNVRNDKFWARTYGGDSIDWIPSIVVAADGNYLLVGSTDSFQTLGSGIWLIDIDSSGTIQWQKVLDDPGVDLAFASDTAADGYVIAGNSHGDVQSYWESTWILLLDESGGMVGYRWIMGEEPGTVQEVVELPDGDYLLGTSTGMVRLDGGLNPVWAKRLWASSSLQLTSMHRAGEDEWVAAGTIQSGDSDSWIAGFGGDGSIRWQNVFGGEGDDRIHDITDSREGGYVAVGDTDSSGAGGSDVWVVRLDGHGIILWQRTYGGMDDDSASSIAEDPRGDLVIVGSTLSFGIGGMDIWAIKLDPDGAVVWEKSYGGLETDEVYSVAISSDEGYIFAGMRNVDLWVLKVDQNGDISESCPDGIGVETFSGAMDSSAVFNDIAMETRDVMVQVRDSDLSTLRSFADIETQCSL